MDNHWQNFTPYPEIIRFEVTNSVKIDSEAGRRWRQVEELARLWRCDACASMMHALT